MKLNEQPAELALKESSESNPWHALTNRVNSNNVPLFIERLPLNLSPGIVILYKIVGQP